MVVIAPMRINTLTFVSSDSPDTNDHQVRPFVDGTDWLGDGHLGLDPPKFFRQSALRSTGELIIGRCECGVIACDDRTVLVDRDDNFVYWRTDSGGDVQFAANEYDTELERAAVDFGWESVGRTAERMVDTAMIGTTTSDGYLFRWSSTRVRADTLTLCFERNGDQRLAALHWSGRADDEVVDAARRCVP